MVTPLKTARKADGRNLTQVDVAAGAQIDPSHYSRIESGAVRPSAEVATRIVVFLNYAISEMQVLYPERFQSEPAGVA